MAPEIRVHGSPEAMAGAAAVEAEAVLRAALAARGRATLAVPGGTTPGPFLKRLGQAALDWERVGVTLTDERWVPVSDPRSNQRLLAETLFAGPAAAAEFVPLYGATAEPEMALGAIATALTRIVLPLDLCVLGMGADMHIASLFPGALGLEAALAPDAPPVAALRVPVAPPVAALRVPVAPPVAARGVPGTAERRISLTARVLAGTGQAILLIRGPAKRAALERAMAARSASEAPIRVVLDGPAPVTVHYAD